MKEIDNHYHRSAALEEKFRDHRLTPQRRMILDVFLSRDDQHLSADEIHNLIRQQEGEIGIATVYRNLDLMAELGLLNKINFGDGRSRYELAQSHLDHHQHHHLVCLCCQEIFEVKDDLLTHLEEQIKKEHNFAIVDHNVQFYGYCAVCQKQVGLTENKSGD